MRFKLSFNAVIETEVPIEKEIELDYSEYNELVAKKSYIDNQERTIQVDKIDEHDSDEINEMLSACVPHNLKMNCVSLTYTNIQLTQID
ncbi:hypothetical protein [Dysgonomonas sp. 520]|uniref:hypothetical protein n=1 Tax=Dysgonomonas sp. 520 TaxID=2302931 RepID=UPI0013D4A1A4|nr:hypothetical protein [Dysgonomonas sp. 520]